MNDLRELRPEEKSGHTLLVDIWSRLATFEANMQHIISAQGRADASRNDIHEKLDKFNRVADTVARLEPIVTMLEQHHLRVDGARKLGDWLGRAMWAAIAAAGAIAVEFIHYFTGRH